MTPRRLTDEVKKAARLTVLFTENEIARLTRVAAYYGQPKSVAAHDMIMKALAEGYDQIGDEELAEAEEKQTSWRERLGL